MAYDIIAGDLKHKGTHDKNDLLCIPHMNLLSVILCANLDLNCDNPCVCKMLMLHNIPCEAYPPNCTVGNVTKSFRMDY